MSHIERFQSIRNGKIGELVSKTDTEVILDFDGEQKTIKMSNLKRWYKPFQLADEEEIKQEKKDVEVNIKIDKIVEKSQENYSEVPARPTVEKDIAKVLTYLEKNSCIITKLSQSYRVRLKGKDFNMLELMWGKRMSSFRILTRTEVMISHRALFEKGVSHPHYGWSLDWVYAFKPRMDITEVYAILDVIIEWAHKYVFELRSREGRKNGRGKVNGKYVLAYKREALGIKDDNGDA